MSAAKTLSNSNPWHIPKFRYLELKNYCRQYDEWNQANTDILLHLSASTVSFKPKSDQMKRAIEDSLSEATYYREQMLTIMSCINKTCNENMQLRELIFAGVVHGLSYDIQTARRPDLGIIPRNVYYDVYRKFFYILDRIRKEQYYDRN